MDIRPIALGVQASPAPLERFAPNATPTPAATAPATRAAADPNVASAQHEPVDQAIKNINKSLQGFGQGLEFSVDTDSQRTVIKVVDLETKQVLRQMPTEEALDIAKMLDRVQGLLINQQA